MAIAIAIGSQGDYGQQKESYTCIQLQFEGCSITL